MRGTGRVFILTGPSGVGKTTVARELLKRVPNLVRLVTYTTRAPRPAEVDGRDYHFITEEEFARKRDAGEFFEWAQVYNDLYGNSRTDLEHIRAAGKDVLLVVDIQGAKTIQSKIPEAISIFLQAESAEALMRRLRMRGKMKPEDEARRAQTASAEMQEAKHCKHTVTAPEGKIEETVQAVFAIIAS